MAFSVDGDLIAGGQTDGDAVLWTTGDWRRFGQPFALGTGSALGVAFSPDGRTLAVAHDDGAVVLWDAEQREPIGPPLPGLENSWVTARFTPDGRRLFAVSDMGRAFRWEVDPKVWRGHACAVTSGGLTSEEWKEVVPEHDYTQVCPE